MSFSPAEYARLKAYAARRNAQRKGDFALTVEAIIEAATIARLDDADAEIARGPR